MEDVYRYYVHCSIIRGEEPVKCTTSDLRRWAGLDKDAHNISNNDLSELHDRSIDGLCSKRDHEEYYLRCRHLCHQFESSIKPMCIRYMELSFSDMHDEIVVYKSIRTILEHFICLPEHADSHQCSFYARERRKLREEAQTWLYKLRTR